MSIYSGFGVRKLETKYNVYLERMYLLLQE